MSSLDVILSGRQAAKDLARIAERGREPSTESWHSAETCTR